MKTSSNLKVIFNFFYNKTIGCKKTRKEFIKFAFIGVLNTSVFYLLYLLFLLLFHYIAAYVCAYGIAIGFSYLMNSRFTFEAPLSIKKALIFPVVYLVQFLVGLVVIRLCVDVLMFSPKISGLLAKGIVFPITFILSRLCLRDRS